VCGAPGCRILMRQEHLSVASWTLDLDSCSLSSPLFFSMGSPGPLIVHKSHQKVQFQLLLHFRSQQNQEGSCCWLELMSGGRGGWVHHVF
jgi:hypothetical protein